MTEMFSTRLYNIVIITDNSGWLFVIILLHTE